LRTPQLVTGAIFTFVFCPSFQRILPARMLIIIFDALSCLFDSEPLDIFFFA